MNDIKALLKEAKTELAGGYYEDAIKLSLKVLTKDQDNYFANVFLGKSYSCLEPPNYSDSVNSYVKATDIMPSNLLAWKGLFQLVQQKDILPNHLSFKKYFELCGKYYEILVSQELSQVELIHEIRIVRKKFPNSEKDFLFGLKDDGPIPAKLASYFMKPDQVIEGLIKICDEEEQQQVSKLVSRKRLKLSANDPNYKSKIDSLAWEIYESSELDVLYEQLINLTNDDDKRANLEGIWLDYRIKILKSMPPNIKLPYFQKVKKMVDDMVLVEHSKISAWKLHFEWEDFVDLDSMDANTIMKFFAKFPTDPLATILYAWLCSQYSIYDMTKNQLNNNKNDTVAANLIADEDLDDEKDKENLMEMVENENSVPLLVESEVIAALIENISKAQGSALAHRIVSNYYVLLREYEAALPYIKKGISLVAYLVRDLGTDVTNSKLALTLDLATSYTYFEAPRHHNAAFQLFEKVLGTDSDNLRAKLGEGLIFVEKENWTSAKAFLTDVTNKFSSNMEILSELGWCDVNLNNFNDALEIFDKVLANVKGTDVRSIDLRAMTLWRQAKCYLHMQQEELRESSQNEEFRYVTIAYKLLVQALKTMDTFANAYSTLGEIYSVYYEDEKRAFTCYYKAFELNFGDYLAAKYMVETYTEMGNWYAAKGVAESLVKFDAARKYLKTESWPYRTIGIAHLENQNAGESIEWFQSAIRVDTNDIESWVGLGEAYLACGRIEASLKVFMKATELDPDHLFAKLFKAISLSELGEFMKSLEVLDELVQSAPNEIQFQVTYAEVCVKHALDLYNQGFLSMSVYTASRTISIIKNIVCKLNSQSYSVWFSLSNALKIFMLVNSKADQIPVDEIVTIFSSAKVHHVEELDAIVSLTLEDILSSTDEDYKKLLGYFYILTNKFAMMTQTFKNEVATIKSSTWHNLGMAELNFYLTMDDQSHRDSAICCFKNSIRYQSNSSQSWIGLGIATMHLNWKVSQHCFIKAFVLSPKDTNVLFDLAVLSLKCNDLELAREIFSRSQSIAPQDSSSWLGSAILLQQEGRTEESKNMFAHSFVLSNGKSKEAQLLYAKSIIDSQVNMSLDERDIEASEQLSAAASGLEHYLKKSPDDAFGLQCSMLILERLHSFDNAREVIEKLSTILENQFEKTQDEKELFNFAIIKAQISRIELGLGNYDKAIESAELSQGIMVDYDNEKSKQTQLSNSICLGLANFFLENFEKTLENFQSLLNQSSPKDSALSHHLIILLSKILYDVGTEETKNIAIDELTDYIANNGNELLISLTIAAISILENNKEYLSVISTELSSFKLAIKNQDRHQDIPYLISEIEKRLKSLKSDSFESIWQQSAFFYPNNYNSWNKLSKRISQRVATNSENKLTSEQLSDQYYKRGDLMTLQRSLYLCPWNSKSLKAMKSCFTIKG